MPIFQPNIQKLTLKNDIEGLIRAAGNPDPDIRRNAISALGQFRESKVTSTLIHHLKDDDRSVRLECVMILGKFRDPVSIQSLEQALNGSDPLYRINVLWALGQIGGNQVLRPIIRSMGDRDKSVRVKAVEIVTRMGKTAYPELRKAIRGRNPLIRRNTINVLGRMKATDFVPFIIAALSDPDPTVRKNAIWALGVLQDPRAVPALERIRSLNASKALKKIKVGPNWRSVAKNYETARRYEDAADLFEMMGEYEEAGRLRRMEKESVFSHKAPHIITDKVDVSNETIIKDSIIHRSSIGKENGQNSGEISRIIDGEIVNRQRYPNLETPGFKVCPFCGTDLNFATTPRFCPYCAEKIRE